MVIRKKLFPILVIILLVLPAVWSFFHSGFFPSDDGEWMVVRLSDFHRSFVSGQIPVRWAARLNHGYGYPVFDFLYPLPFYWGETFHLLGFSFVNSIKLVFIFSFLFSAVLMYFFAFELWGSWGGLVSAIFYVYAPYRFLDAYVRGSIGEAVSFIFVPLIFWMIHRLSMKQNWLDVVLGAFGLAGLIMSHNIMAMLFVPIALLAMAWYGVRAKSRKTLAGYYFSLVLAGLGLSCFFWFPALYDKQFIVLDRVSVANFWEHFPSLKQLVFPSWGYGPSVAGTGDKASYQLGFFHFLGVGLVIVFLIKFWFKKQARCFQTLFFLLTFWGALFLMLSVSIPVWHLIPMLWRIQFPWRFLGVTTFASAVLAGATVQLVESKWRGIWVLIFILAAVFYGSRYARPEHFVNRPKSFYTTNEATTTVKDEYMPIWVKEKPQKHAEKKIEVIKGKGRVGNLFFNSKKMAFLLNNKTEVAVQANIVYFPGWQVKIDKNPVEISYQNRGLITFLAPSGKHQVAILFKETTARIVADAVSLTSLLIVGGLLMKKRK